MPKKKINNRDSGQKLAGNKKLTPETIKPVLANSSKQTTKNLRDLFTLISSRDKQKNNYSVNFFLKSPKL